MVLKEFQGNIQMPELLAVRGIVPTVNRHRRVQGWVAMRCTPYLISAVDIVLKSSWMSLADGTTVLLSPQLMLMESINITISIPITALGVNFCSISRRDCAIAVAIDTDRW